MDIFTSLWKKDCYILKLPNLIISILEDSHNRKLKLQKTFTSWISTCKIKIIEIGDDMADSTIWFDMEWPRFYCVASVLRDPQLLGAEL